MFSVFTGAAPADVVPVFGDAGTGGADAAAPSHLPQSHSPQGTSARFPIDGARGYKVRGVASASNTDACNVEERKIPENTREVTRRTDRSGRDARITHANGGASVVAVPAGSSGHGAGVVAVPAGTGARSAGAVAVPADTSGRGAGAVAVPVDAGGRDAGAVAVPAVDRQRPSSNADRDIVLVTKSLRELTTRDAATVDVVGTPTGVFPSALALL